MVPQKFRLPFLLLAIVLVGLGLYIFLNNNTSQPAGEITTFEECVAAGNPVMESYPPQCRTEDGKTITQNIGNEMDLMDVIIIERPRPLNVVSSPFPIKGRARGTYFFEGTFPVRLVDENGVELAESFVTAEGEWMTEEFVPFTGELEFETDATSGTLYLEKSNPSGLPENAQTLEVPVRFE